MQTGTLGVQMKGVLPWLVCWARHADYNRLLSCIACSSQYKILFSSSHTFSLYQSPLPSNLGRQSCWVACLCVSSRQKLFHSSCTVKKVSGFQVPSQDVTYQTLPGRKYSKYSRPGKVLVSDIPGWENRKPILQ
jgi:hypothetical protein